MARNEGLLRINASRQGIAFQSQDVRRLELGAGPRRERPKGLTQSEQELQRALDANPVTATRPQVLIGERQHRLYLLDPRKIDYIESDRNYVTLWMAGKEYISRDSIKRLSTVLASVGFVRIERSVLINIGAVQYAQAAGRRSFAFTLHSGACLHSSPGFRDSILRVLPLVSKSNR